MLTLAVAFGAALLLIAAYFTYGRWIAGRVFAVDREANVPSEALRDDKDFVPTRRQVLFGHHFTSIAGTGPIVGPAIAVFWGWIPAVMWVVLGSIFVGAVHDFGSLIISIRNRGQSLGEIAGRLISRRAKILFLLILFFALMIVLGVFGLVIANLFIEYPETILSVWVAMPVAMILGVGMQRGGISPWWSLVGLVILYAAIYVGVYHWPGPDGFSSLAFIQEMIDWKSYRINAPVVGWTVALAVYCFLASILPVWLLLQPRDYLNAQQLVVALVLLVGGLVVACVTGTARIETAPAIATDVSWWTGATPLFPFLFITIACGACSGFHCLVASGTSSKQIARETDAPSIGYGGMLLEGALAVLVILACCAGVGMISSPEKLAKLGQLAVGPGQDAGVAPADGGALWLRLYDVATLPAPRIAVPAFVEGGAAFLTAVGIPPALGVGIVATLVACFAATTIDTATRLQRYVIQELGDAIAVPPLKRPLVATSVAVGTGFLVAMLPGPTGIGSGGQLLWPLFGAVNQLLAGLAFLVIAFYLWRRSRPVFFVLAPMSLMLLMPAWALILQMFHPDTGFWATGNYALFAFGLGILALQVWMVIEAVILFPRARSVLEQTLPPLPPRGTSGTARPEVSVEGV